MPKSDFVFLPISHRRVSQRVQEFATRLGWGTLKACTAIDGEIDRSITFPSCVFWWETSIEKFTLHIVPGGSSSTYLSHSEVERFVDPFRELYATVNSNAYPVYIGPVRFAFSNRANIGRLAAETSPLLGIDNFRLRVGVKKLLKRYPCIDCSNDDFRPTSFMVTRGKLLKS